MGENKRNLVGEFILALTISSVFHIEEPGIGLWQPQPIAMKIQRVSRFKKDTGNGFGKTLASETAAVGLTL